MRKKKRKLKWFELNNISKKLNIFIYYFNYLILLMMSTPSSDYIISNNNHFSNLLSHIIIDYLV